MRRMVAVAILLSGFAFCYADQGRGADKGKGADKSEGADKSKGKSASAAQSRKGGGGDSYFHQKGYTHLKIPPGHYPPPGGCRIWFPGRPPGQQPPPGDCRVLGPRVPLGAWLIRHPVDYPDHVHIAVYDDHRPGSVLAVGEFNIGSGVFVRVVVDK